MSLALTSRPAVADDEFTGTDGNDIFDGSGGNDIINGKAGNDKLTGGAGNDTINGGAGIDTAVFSGNFANYSFALNNGDHILTSALEGKDTLTDVEFARFADGVYDFATETFTQQQYRADQYPALENRPLRRHADLDHGRPAQRQGRRWRRAHLYADRRRRTIISG